MSWCSSSPGVWSITLISMISAAALLRILLREPWWSPHPGGTCSSLWTCSCWSLSRTLCPCCLTQWLPQYWYVLTSGSTSIYLIQQFWATLGSQCWIFLTGWIWPVTLLSEQSGPLPFLLLIMSTPRTTALDQTVVEGPESQHDIGALQSALSVTVSCWEREREREGESLLIKR